MGKAQAQSSKKPVIASSSSSDEETNLRFVDEEGRLKFEREIKKRNFHLEKGFFILDSPHYGLTEDVAELIDSHNWKKFVTHPREPIIPFVREFYANLTSPQQKYVIVRGSKVSFSAPTLNRRWGLKDVEDEYLTLLKNAEETELNDMMREVTVEGADWIKTDEIWKIARPDLSPLAKVWYHVIRTKILPTAHLETVNKERLVLLYCILKKKKVDVGQLIEREIIACAFKKKGLLIFPSLITSLCLRCGIKALSEDEIMDNKGAIDLLAIKRFGASASKVQGSVPPSGQQEHLDDVNTKVDQCYQMLQHSLKQQQLFWEFSKEQHLWMQRTLGINKLRQGSYPPLFPEEIFEPFQYSPSEPMKQTNPAKEPAPANPPAPEQDPEIPSVNSTASEHSVNNNEVSSDWTPPPPPRDPTPPPTQPSGSKRGKEKLVDEAPEDPPPPKKGRIKHRAPPRIRKQLGIDVNAKETPTALSEDSEDNMPIMGRIGKLKAFTVSKAQPRAGGGEEEDEAEKEKSAELTITKEISGTKKPTMKQMARSGSRRSSARLAQP